MRYQTAGVLGMKEVFGRIISHIKKGNRYWKSKKKVIGERRLRYE